MLYHGVLAPNSKYRARVVGYGKEQESEKHKQHIPLELLLSIQKEGQLPLLIDGKPILYSTKQYEEVFNKSYRPTQWADLMKRAFSIDVLECPKCKGRLRLVACITDSKTISEILKSLDLPEVDPKLSPARSSPEPDTDLSLFDVA